MAVENITLNLIPTGDTPSIHVAQFDVERPFTVTLKEGVDDFTPTGYDIELQVRKVDNNIVTAVPVQTSGNVVTFGTTEQMTACSGTNIAELQLTKDSQTFATLHFYLVVQRDVLAGGVTSESDIYNLTEQIAAIVPEVIGDDYYTAEEVDEKIAEIPTFDPTNYYDKSDVDYDKSETDALLDDKANVSDLPDMSNYYDKSETDALLDDKANVSDLPDMTDYYTKSEVDTKITDLTQIKTVSGSLIHITDGGDNIPVKSLVSEIVAVQSGSGEKSPDNPYTISGFDNGIITRCGKNLWSNEKAVADSNTSTVYIENEWLNFTTGQYRLLYNFTYSGRVTLSAIVKNKVATLNTVTISAVYSDGTTGIVATIRLTDQKEHTISGTTASDKTLVGFRTTWTDSQPACMKNIQLELGDTATNFEAYNGNTYTFTFGQTVFGGHYDNKGNLVVNRGELVLSSLNWYYSTNGYFEAPINIDCPTRTQWVAQNGNCGIYTIVSMYFVTNSGDRVNNSIAWYSNVIRVADNSTTDVSTFVANLQNQSVYYEISTPITLSITSQDIPTLLGENNIFSNCGDVEVNYFTNKSNGIAELIKAFM